MYPVRTPLTSSGPRSDAALLLLIVGPKLLGVDIAAEYGVGSGEEISTSAPHRGMRWAYRRLDVRGLRGSEVVLPPGTTIGDAESRRPDDRPGTEGCRRDGKIIDHTTIRLAARRCRRNHHKTEVPGRRSSAEFGDEVGDRELLDGRWTPSMWW